MADSVVEVKCRECNRKLRSGVQCELCLSWFHMKCSKLEDCFQEGWKCQHCKETVNQRLLEEKDRELEDLKERLKIAEKKNAELTQEVSSLKIQDWPNSVVEVKFRECNRKLRYGVQCELCLSWFHMKCSKLEDCFQEGWKCLHCKETVNQRLLEEKDRELEDLKERLKIAEKKNAELTQEVSSLKIQDWPNSVVEVKFRECNRKLRYGVQCELCLSWFHMKCSKLEDCFQEGWKCLHCKETVNQRLLEEKDRELEDLKERLKIAEKKNAELTQENSSLKIQVGESEKGMVFHSRVGTNVIIGIDGRAIVKKNIDQWEDGVAFTSRPLENNELFEVILDKRSKYGSSFGIGVLTVRPEDYEFPMRAKDSRHTWMYDGNRIWNNVTCKQSDYSVNINNLPAGTRYGIMKKSSGDVHFFINGEDKGSAPSGICGPVYGVMDLWDGAEKFTILKP